MAKLDQESVDEDTVKENNNSSSKDNMENSVSMIHGHSDNQSKTTDGNVQDNTEDSFIMAHGSARGKPAEGNKAIGPEKYHYGPPGFQGWALGISYAFLWYFSILMGFFVIYCPILPLLFINRSAYRRITEVVFVMWESYAVALMELVYGIKFFVSGDSICSSERALMVLNHRNRLDWNYFWGCLAHAVILPSHNCKIVLKAVIRKFPGIGWIMQMACYLYIKRRWEDDQVLMNKVLDYYKDIKHTFQVLIFPEGTNLTPETQQRSNAYARKSGQQEYDYVLHPRTTGFAFLVDRMRKGDQLDAVYDVTVAYPKTIPTSELDILKGRFPQEVHFHIKRYHASVIPNTEGEVRRWLEDVWREKEKMLKITYAQGHFPGSEGQPPSSPVNASYLSILFWTPFTLVSFYLMCTWWPMQIWCLIHSVLFIIISSFTEGFQHIEIDLYRRQNKIDKVDKSQ